MPVNQSTPRPITPEQLRDARRLLGWSRDRLAGRSDTNLGFIGVFEDTGRIARFLWHPDGFNALDAIRTALEQAGVTFTNGDEPGVKHKRKLDRSTKHEDAATFNPAAKTRASR